MTETRKVVINVQFGGFGLSAAAYEKLIEWGVPVRKYLKQPRNEETGLYEKIPENEGEIIFDRDLTPESEDDSFGKIWREARASGSRLFGARYWETWLDGQRDNPMLVRAVEELGAKANGPCATLKVVEIPADVEYEISEYDGNEHIAQKHRTWS